LERDRIRWIAGIAMAGAWSVVELRIWIRKGVYRLKFLQNHCVRQNFHRLLNVPEPSQSLLPETEREACPIRPPIISDFSYLFPHV